MTNPTLPLPFAMALCVFTVGLSSCTSVTEETDTDEPADTAPVDSDTGFMGLCGYIDVAMLYVPPGGFSMGTPGEEQGRHENEEQHDVILTNGFCMAQHEITQRTFEEYAGYNPSFNISCGEYCPAEGVSWNEAAWFTNVLSGFFGFEYCYACEGTARNATCYSRKNPYECEGYRLPTEAEWEYAARAGEVAAFPNGGNLVEGFVDDCTGDTELDNRGRVDDVGWYCGNAQEKTHEVAVKVRNSLYLYDVSGNVAEWTHDWYSEFYGGDATDPFGPSTGTWRTLRGGSFADTPSGVRVGARVRQGPDTQSRTQGLRIVQTWNQ